MTEQSPLPQQPEPLDRREARRQRRAERLADPSRGGTWIMGLILILLGGLFLLQNVRGFDFSFTNWWALFILIPAFGALETALRIYRQNGNQWTNQVSASLILGGLLCLVAGGFLFEISWTYFGPVLLILAGLGILLPNAFRQG